MESFAVKKSKTLKRKMSTRLNTIKQRKVLEEEMDTRSAVAKRPKMDEIKEPMQTSSQTKEVPKCGCSIPIFKYCHDQPNYVDKTMLIKRLLPHSHRLITAPSGFGKSLNMNMIRKFIEIKLGKDGKPIKLNLDKNHCLESSEKNINFEYFKGKKIFNEKEFMLEHFGQYPTIYAQFGDVKGSTFENVLYKLKSAINQSFGEHVYLRDSSLWDRCNLSKIRFMKYLDVVECQSLNQYEVEESLAYLAKCLYHHHHEREVYVLIDEFDVPINAMIFQDVMSEGDRVLTINCVRSIINNLLNRCTEILAGSLLHGCHQFAGIFSGDANNLMHYAFMQGHEYCEYYGFLEEEINELLERMKQTENFSMINHYYGGYKTKLKHNARDIIIYNPRAVSNFFIRKEFATYLQSGISRKLQKAVGHVRIRPRIERIMNGEDNDIHCVEKLQIEHMEDLRLMLNENTITTKDQDLLLQFLYGQGYFYPIGISSNIGRLQLAIPNQSVMNKIEQMITEANLTSSIMTDHNNFNDAVYNLTKSCKTKDFTNVAKSIMNMILKMEQSPIHEMEFQCDLRAALKKKFLIVDIERKSRSGIACDLIIIDNSSGVGFIVEVKLGRKDKKHCCEAAHRQIFTRKYDSILDDIWIKKLYPNFSAGTRTGWLESRLGSGLVVDQNKILMLTV
ncbi:hypothetical protein PV327_008075 [Microctonus hyperodae]|uniref:AAA-ATPase-like domain-containing protein n=1 Tax=Microctonus hyperodae TaxID=165561 RepID=A0AA39F2D7_MICHY|nr:hypothetical protein PV327_008075 [Microctonus hyperodae]